MQHKYYVDVKRPVFMTQWTIAGQLLPTSEIRLRPNIHMAPMTEDDAKELNDGMQVPRDLFKLPHPMWAMLQPPKTEVRSSTRLQIDVNADSEDDAILAATKIADLLLLSLSMVVPGLRYYADLKRVRQLGVPGERSAWSGPWGSVVYEAPKQLTVDYNERALKIMTKVEEDVVAETAYTHLLSAWKLRDTLGAPLQRSILQHYVLSFEAITQGVMAVHRKSVAEKVRLEERTFASEFAASLTQRSDKPKAIRDASTKLREISLTNTLPAIAKTAEIIGLSEQAKERAVALFRYRSTTLSHPGKKLDEAEAHAWIWGEDASGLSPADETAREFLQRYCEYV